MLNVNKKISWQELLVIVFCVILTGRPSRFLLWWQNSSAWQKNICEKEKFLFSSICNFRFFYELIAAKYCFPIFFIWNIVDLFAVLSQIDSFTLSPSFNYFFSIHMSYLRKINLVTSILSSWLCSPEWFPLCGERQKWVCWNCWTTMLNCPGIRQTFS